MNIAIKTFNPEIDGDWQRKNTFKDSDVEYL